MSEWAAGNPKLIEDITEVCFSSSILVSVEQLSAPASRLVLGFPGQFWATLGVGVHCFRPLSCAQVLLEEGAFKLVEEPPLAPGDPPRYTHA